MNKIGLIYLNKNSDWVSCQSIQRNLAEAYELSQLNIVHLRLNSDSYSDQIEISQKIIKEKYDQLIFIDHRFFPFFILSYLDHSDCYPRLTFHLYGDFFLNLSKWGLCEDKLKKFHLKLVCASTAQVALVQSFIHNPDIVFACPFPVSNDFKFNSINESQAIEQLMLKDKDKLIILYTGRISYQKNVLPLILAFANHIAPLISNAELHIAGEFDDIALPYFGIGRSPLSMQYTFFNLIETLPESIKKRVNFLGNLDQIKLKDQYLISDVFVSLSTHNDEDFGMSPAEALLSGLPLVLSNWGGFASFKKIAPKAVSLVNVNKDKHHYTCNSNLGKLSSSIIKALMNNKNKDVISKQAQSAFSIESIANKVKAINDFPFSTFNGFNDVFKKSEEVSRSDLMFGDTRFNQEDYVRIYECYINPFRGHNEP